MSHVAHNSTSINWHASSEQNVYSQGRHLTRYPHHAVVGFIFSHFGHIAEHAAIRILELGCGAGNNLWFAAREGFTVAGIDGSPTATEYAANRFAAERLQGDLRVGDFSQLPWPDETFDIVLDRGSLAHATSKKIIESALTEAGRVLKGRGWLWSTIYSWEHPGRLHGCHLGGNTNGGFTDGYFLGLGTVNFVVREEIDVLYGSRFKIATLTHTREEIFLDQPCMVNAFWKIEGVKER